jgi:hypothetical protein
MLSVILGVHLALWIAICSTVSPLHIIQKEMVWRTHAP